MHYTLKHFDLVKASCTENEITFLEVGKFEIHYKMGLRWG